jgi:hypothetical protein
MHSVRPLSLGQFNVEKDALAANIANEKKMKEMLGGS